MNLLTFYQNGKFDAAGYVHATRLWTLTLEISVMMAQFPSKEIVHISYDFSILGLGYANIGGLLMTMGLDYDFAEGRALCGALTAVMASIMDSGTSRHVPTASKRRFTTAPSSAVAAWPRQYTLAPSLTMQGVFGISRTTFASSCVAFWEWLS